MERNKIILFVCCVLTILSQVECNSDNYTEDDNLIYTSISDMERLLTTAFKIQEKTKRLGNFYNTKLMEMIMTLRGLDNDIMKENKYMHVLNPIFFIKSILNINRVLETHRYYIRQIENVNDDLSRLSLVKSKAKSLNVDPHIKTFLELQDFYDFDTQEAGDGILKNCSIKISLSALDCYEIGDWALENRDAYHAKLWFNEAKRRLISNPADRTISLERILLKLANVYSVYKDGETANQYIDEILKTDPENKAALEFKVILAGSNSIFNQLVDRYRTVPYTHNLGESSNVMWIQQLCQLNQKFIQQPDTFCYYEPIYLYYTIKVEVLRTEPVLAILRGIITKEEILAVHQQAAFQMRTRLGTNHSTIIDFKSNNLIKIFKKKLDLFLRGPTEILENFLYAAFDIGEYQKLRRKPLKIHKNFRKYENEKDGYLLMFFLNNVEGGGHVIFPSLNISVPPRKGDALVWDYKPGKEDKYFIHTVCPVYVGNCTVMYIRAHSHVGEYRKATTN